MRLAFVFPPSMPPTSPPCGIAYLKAFLGCGKAFDLNLLYHDTAEEMVHRGELPAKGLEPEQLREAVTFLKGNRNFYDQEEYNRAVSIFLGYFTELHTDMQKECTKYLEGFPEDTLLDFLDRLLLPVRQYNPDAVGISQIVLLQREFVLALAKHLHQEDITLILGGASLSYNPEAYLSVVGTTDFSHIFDAVFYGEGELPLKAYVEGEPLEKISNTVYKSDRIMKNRETGIENLDDLSPPDFGDFPLQEYYTPEIVLPLLTSRGCPWRRCTFCTHYRSYYKYRTRSIEKVVSDLKELQKYKASHFLLADEMIEPSRFYELADSIEKEGLNIRFYSEAKPTKEFSRELLRRMYGAGVRALLWGVESGTQRILDVLDKGTCVRDIENVLRDSHEAGIWNVVFMIIQSPTQRKEEIEQDIAFLQKNSNIISTVTGSSFRLEVGSRMYRHPERFGIKVKEHDDPFTPVRYYEDSGGVSAEESDFLFKKYNVEFVMLSRVSWYFGKMRDHMLLFADHLSKDPLRT